MSSIVITFPKQPATGHLARRLLYALEQPDDDFRIAGSPAVAGAIIQLVNEFGRQPQAKGLAGWFATRIGFSVFESSHNDSDTARQGPF